MTSTKPTSRPFPPTRTFILGWAIVMLSLTFVVGRPWETFIHMWRVEFVASLFLGLILILTFVRGTRNLFPDLSRLEVRFVVFPMLALIAWSAVSVIWAPSGGSAIHHALVWSAYLIFFVLIRWILNRGSALGLSLAMLVGGLVFAAIPAVSGYIAYQIFGGALKTGILFQKSGEQVITLLPLALVAIVRLNDRKFPFGVVAVAAMWVLILSTLGRINTALFIVGFAVTSIFLAAFRSNSVIRRRLALISIVLAIIPAALFLSARLSSQETITVADRLIGDENAQSSNDFRKLMLTISAEMIKSSPVVGIGADNFGFQFNEYRRVYGSQRPGDKNLAFAESEIPERAHNEFVQIVAELGGVGGLIVAWLMTGIGLMIYRAVKYRLFSPYRLTALLGIVLFLASSLVSSYSFRLIQNGFVFFFVLAVASKYFLREKDTTRVAELPGRSRVFAVAGLAACILLAAYSGLRVASVIATRAGDEIADLNVAADRYRIAVVLDHENPYAPNVLGMRLLFDKRPSDAAPFLEDAIRIGKATSVDFSYLATSYALAGDKIAAEQTMARAVSMYPRSVFVLVRYAVLLEANRKRDKATEYFDRAKSIDDRAANSWRELIVNGPEATSQKAFQDKSAYTAVMDLQPQAAIYAVLDEQKIGSEKDWKKVGP